VAPALAGEWVDLNPGGGGAFTTIGAGPTGIIISGSDLSGAYRSLDQGQTWDLIGADRGLKRTHVSSVGFDPVDGQIIHLGTEVGIYRSADGGDTFQQVLATGYIGAVAPARSNPSIVYAAWHALWTSSGPVIYRSADRGLTWAPVSVDLPADARALKLIVSTTDPNRLYLVSGKDIFVPAAPTLWRSVDGGVHWTRIGTALGNIWDLAMDPATPATLYVTVYQGTPRASWSGSVWKSTDGGDTWTQKGAHTGAILVKRDQPQVVRVIDVDRHTIDSESGVWESTDGADTWLRKSTMTGWTSGWMSIDWAYAGGGYGMAKVLGEDLSHPDAILWANWYFVFGSFDGGGQFQNLVTRQVSPGSWRSRGIDNVTLTSISIGETDADKIYVGYHDLGLWRSLDGGASWQSGNNPALTGSWNGYGGNVTAVLADPDRSGVVWAANGEDADTTKLARSTAAGAPASWTQVSGVAKGFIRGLSLSRTSPANLRTLFVTRNGDIYRSQDDGVNWAKVFDSNQARATAVDRFDGTLVYAGGEGGLWRSHSSGAPGTWSPIGLPQMAGTNAEPLVNERWEGVHQIVADPVRKGWAYVAAYGLGRGIYRTTDYGVTWTLLRAGTYMRDVAVDPVNPQVLYACGSRAFKSGSVAAGSEGILRSIDGGAAWTSLNDGLPWPFGARIAVDPWNRNRLILGSPGAGFRERILLGEVAGVGDAVAPSGVSLSEARPNPSPGAVSFALALERGGRLDWGVYDLHGRVIWRESRDYGAGSVTLAWNGTGSDGTRRGSGVYFARVRVDGQTMVRRFALVR
jgi:hypothetical protein